MEYIRWFHQIDSKDVDLVGGKGANLGEMARAELPVPPGFCLTARAYRNFIEFSRLEGPIDEILTDMRVDDAEDVNEKS